MNSLVPIPNTTAQNPELQTLGPQTEHVVKERRRGLLDHEQTAESHQEIKVDRNEVKAQVASLISSTSIAIARLESQIAKHGSNSAAQDKLIQYQTLQANAYVILSELSEPGSARNLFAFSEALAQIQDMANVESDKKDDGSSSEDAQRKPLISPQLPPDEVIADQPLVRHLAHHAQKLFNFSDDSAVFSTEAAPKVEDGYKDVLAAVAVAASLYEAEKNGNPGAAQMASDTLAKRSDEIAQQAVAMGASGEEAQQIAAARVQTISEKARYIHEGTLKSDAEGASRISDVFNEFVQQPLMAHVAKSDAHFQEARANMLVGSPAHRKMAHELESWDVLREKTETLAAPSAAGPEIAHGSGAELYDGLMKSVDLDGRFAKGREIAQKSSELHLKHANAYHHAGKLSHDLEKKVAAEMKGDSHHLHHLAKELGVSDKQLRVAVLNARVEMGAPLDEHGEMFRRDRIDLQLAQGQGAGIAQA